MDSDGLSRTLNMSIAPLFVNHYLKCPLTDVVYASQCLCLCSTLFPSAISSKRNLIENRIIDILFKIRDYKGSVGIIKVRFLCSSGALFSLFLCRTLVSAMPK